MRAFCSTMLAVALLPWSARADLQTFVEKEDTSFKWSRVRGSAPGAPVEYAQLHLVSQTWRGTPWQHRLVVAKSPGVKQASHALLIIGGGSWREGIEKEPIKTDSREMQIALAISNSIQMPVAFLSHVPFQPLFDGRKEDQIISYTFDKFLRSGDDEWPLLLPMTKSAVRAMDTIQVFAREEWKLEVAKFIVTGASKRGWTTWLTAAADPRVAGIAPMVIDALNMDKQMQHQKEVYGQYSEQISDYTELGIQDQMDSDAGRKLLALVDPYSYRQRLTMPKMVILGTNDPYWTLDALNLYYDELKGDKYVLYIPNAGHGLENDLGRLVNGISAFTLKVAGKLQFPRLTWDIEKQPDSVRFRIRSDKTPVSVSIWTTRSDTQDFRKAKWVSRVLKSGEDGFEYELKRPESGYAAALGEALYDIDGRPLYLSTNVGIIGAEASGK